MYHDPGLRNSNSKMKCRLLSHWIRLLFRYQGPKGYISEYYRDSFVIKQDRRSILYANEVLIAGLA